MEFAQKWEIPRILTQDLEKYLKFGNSVFQDSLSRYH